MEEDLRIPYAASLFRSEAALWWRNKTATWIDALDWTAFEEEVIKQFSPINTVKAARDKLYSLKQFTSVHKYIAEFNNLILQIPANEITEQEKMHKFCNGLKPEI